MQSICITKSKEYYIIADGTQEYLINTDIIIREIYPNVD